MKKNWVIFIVICAATWFWMVSRQYQQQRAYERTHAEATAKYSAWKADQAELEAQKAEARRVAEESLKQVEALITTAPEKVAEDPELRTQVRQLQRQLFSPTTAPKHIIETDLYRVVFSELGARPIQWEIKSSRFVTNLSQEGTSSTIQMIPQVKLEEGREYPLGLVGNTARDLNDRLFTTTITRSDEGIRVVFTSDPDPEHDLIATKDFLFRHDSFVVDLTVTFKNGPRTIKLLGGRQGYGIGWQGGFGDPEVADRLHGLVNVVYGLGEDVRTRTLSKSEDKLELETAVSWIGQEKKFFTGLLIPAPANAPTMVRAYIDRKNDAPEFRVKGVTQPVNVDLLHEPVELKEGESVALSYKLFVGPKNFEALGDDVLAFAGAVPAKGDELLTTPKSVIFHTMPLGMSFLRPLAIWLVYLMRWLHEMIGQWGIAIIITTLVVRFCMLPLTWFAVVGQAKTMAEQARIRPEMDAINKKFKEDPMKRGQAIMQLYRDHNISHLGMLRGCVPALLQAPIFMALYVLFDQAVELRGQSFLWIRDLAGPDRLIDWGVNIPLIGTSLNLLPIIMGFTNYLLMKVMQMPAQDDLQNQIQKQMMIMMPIMFTFFLYQLPSGLVLYWVVSNTISIGQSFLTKRISKHYQAAYEANGKPA